MFHEQLATVSDRCSGTPDDLETEAGSGASGRTFWDQRNCGSLIALAVTDHAGRSKHAAQSGSCHVPMRSRPSGKDRFDDVGKPSWLRACRHLVWVAIAGLTLAAGQSQAAAGLTFTPAAPIVPEASTALYGVTLAQMPTANVTVAVSRVTGDNSDLTVAPVSASLTFTGTNWNTAQSVTLSAASDDDGGDEAVRIGHALSGAAEYTSLGTVTVTARIADDDKPGLVFSDAQVRIPEGNSVSYGLSLSTKPSASVTVMVAKASGTQDADLNLSGTTTFTFTATTWNVAQQVTLTATADTDSTDGTAAFAHTASGGDYANISANLTATEIDAASARIVIWPAVLDMTEGGTKGYNVVLGSEPTADVTVSTRINAPHWSNVATLVFVDTDKDTPGNQASLTFTATNWSIAQRVSVSVSADSDSQDESAAILHTASATGGYANAQVARLSLEVEDDENYLDLDFSRQIRLIPEGGSAKVRFRLKSPISSTVLFSLSADSSYFTINPNWPPDPLNSVVENFIFTPENYDTYVTITFWAPDNSDAEHVEQTFLLRLSGDDIPANTSVPITIGLIDDDAGLIIRNTSGQDIASLDVNENSSQFYTVALAARNARSNDTRITLRTKAGGDPNFVVQPAQLAFSQSNWSTGQTVKISSQSDLDAIDGISAVEHISGQTHSLDAYTGIGATLAVTEVDNDTAGISLSATELKLSEAESATYMVNLDSQPSAAVTVSLSVSAPHWSTVSSDLSVDTDSGTAGDQSTLIFTTSDWSNAQTVTVSSSDDTDLENESAEILHTASMTGDYGQVAPARLSILVEDDENPLEVPLSRSGIVFTEGQSGVFGVRVKSAITKNLTVLIDTSNITIATVSPATMTFTATDYATFQNITVAVPDNDIARNVNETMNLLVSGEGLTAKFFPIDIFAQDDDAGLVIQQSGSNISSLEVDEGSSQIYTVALAARNDVSENTEISVLMPSTGDADLSVLPSILTFSRTDWNTGQSVTVVAAEDDDAVEGLSSVEHVSQQMVVPDSAADAYIGVAATIAVSEDDNDSVGLKLSTTSLSLPEGTQTTYTLVLESEPTADVSVTIRKALAGTQDVNLSLLGGTSLGFTTTNWNTAQTLTMNATNDTDILNGTAVFVHRASGGDYLGVTASLTVTEIDDEPEFELSATELTVTEGGHASYTVKLAVAPTGSVTVTVARSTAGTQDEDLSLSVPSTGKLTFKTDNWDTVQTVSLTAAADDDAVDGTAQILHTATGGDYGFAMASLTATEDDIQTAKLTLSPTSLDVSEGGSASYTVVLDSEPTATVTVTVAKSTDGSPDADLTLSSPSGGELTFTNGSNGNWNTAQTVVVAAAADNDDVAEGTAVFTHSATGGDYNNLSATLTATEADDDATLTLSTTALTVSEGGSANYTLQLATKPTADVTVTITRSSSQGTDTDLSATVTPTDGFLTFTTDSWNTAQTVAVAAAADNDEVAEGTAEFEHSATGGGYADATATLTATEEDDDATLTLSATSLTVSEAGSANYTVVLDTQPTGAVTIAIANPSDGTHDVDLTVSKTSLTFDASTWNTAKTVAVSAAADNADVANGTALFEHTATGGGYGGVTATLSATEDDDDTISLVLSATAIEVSEGGSKSYSVRLDSEPTAEVTVDIDHPMGSTNDDDLTVSPAQLKFTTDNWSSAQMVAVTATADTDMSDGTAVFVHDASAGGYDNVSATLTATELDNDLARILVRPLSVLVTESGSTTYGVVLGSAPTADVTVSTKIVAPHWNDAATFVKVDTNPNMSDNQATLTFKATNWNTVQSVTVSALNEEDVTLENTDSLNERVRIVHSASDTGGYGNAPNADLVLDVVDDDNVLDISLSRAGLVFTEGGTARFKVRVKSAIAADVTVRSSLDATSGLTASPSILTFTTGNYRVFQTVNVTGTEDIEAAHVTANMTVFATGGLAQTNLIPVFMYDNDAALLIKRGGSSIASLTVAEGGTETYQVSLKARNGVSANTKIRIASDGDSDLTVLPSTLTFSQSNWNTVQNIVVSAAEDDDAVAGTAVVEHVSEQTAATDAYVGVSATLAVTESETDTAGVMLTPTSLTVSEGGTKTYSVVLKSEPTADVAVSITQPSSDTDDDDLTISASTLNFTTDDWNTAQNVTVTAAADNSDAVHGTASFLHTASGGDYTGLTATLPVTEDDDDAALTLGTPTIATEGGSAGSYTVKLAALPSGDVTVAMTSGDEAAVTVSTANTDDKLTFTATNWNQTQAVMLTAVADSDGSDESVAISHMASGGSYDNVSATATAVVHDDDGVVTVVGSPVALTEGGSAGSYTIALAAAPTANVTVTVTSSDTDAVTVSTSNTDNKLTFMTDSYGAKTVTVTPVDDGDGADESVTITHRSSTGGYGRLIGSVTVSATVDDNDVGLMVERPWRP